MHRAPSESAVDPKVETRAETDIAGYVSRRASRWRGGARSATYPAHAEKRTHRDAGFANSASRIQLALLARKFADEMCTINVGKDGL